MSHAERWARVKEILGMCLDQPAESRATVLARECGNDADLRAEVESLLETPELSDDLAGGAASAIATAIDATPSEPVSEERIGERIGRYKLLEKIGEGGFGVVYLAEQVRPVSRRVAIKIVKRGMDTKQVVARFKQEQQALARLEHPNICKVIDAGETPSGRPYIVMEYVPSVDIVTHCDSERLTIRERIDLLVPICEAVTHAHQRAIIHRDIKPSNLLVARGTDRPVVKLIDFGVAKAIGGRLIDATLHTEQRSHLGTPAYMAPEQAQYGGHDVDTRADVYSLGAVLYQLLVGATPHDAAQLRSANLFEIGRILREVEPPPPSDRAQGLGELLPTVAAERRLTPGELVAAVRGELDWIVCKAIEKDLPRRYPSASDLAADLRRYLCGEAVTAAPPSMVYRARKFVRRNRGLVVSGAALGSAIVVTGVVLTGAYVVVSGTNAQLKVTTDRAVRSLYLSLVLAAHASLSAAEYAQARDVLNEVARECPDEFHGWEWRYLGGQALKFDQSNSVSNINAIFKNSSADGDRILFQVGNKQLEVWDAARRMRLSVIDTEWDLAWAWLLPDGKTVVAGFTAESKGGLPCGFDATTGKHVFQLTGVAPELGGWALRAWAGSGDAFLTWTNDGAWRVWNARNGALVRELRFDESVDTQAHALNLYLDEHAERVAVTGSDGSVRIVELSSDREWPLVGACEGGSRQLKFHPLAPEIVISDETRGLLACDVSTGKQVRAFDCGGARVLSAVLSANGATVAAWCSDSFTRVWEYATGRLLLAERRQWGYTDLPLSGDGRRLLIVEASGAATLWDLTTGRVVVQSAYVTDVDPWYRGFIRGEGGEEVVLIRAGAMQVIKPDRCAGLVRSAAYLALGVIQPGTVHLADVQRIVHYGPSGQLWIYNRLTGEACGGPFECNPRVVKIVRAGSDLVVASIGYPIRVIDAASGRQRHAFDLGGVSQNELRLQELSGSRLFVSASDGSSAQIWSLETGERLVQFNAALDTSRWEFVSDGSRALNATERAIEQWSLSAGERLPSLAHNLGALPSMTLSPDGRTLLLESPKCVQAWGLPQGELKWVHHGRAVDMVEFRAKGATVALFETSDYQQGTANVVSLLDATTGGLLGGPWRLCDTSYAYQVGLVELTPTRVGIVNGGFLRIIDARDGHEVSALPLDQNDSCSLTFWTSLDKGRLVISNLRDGPQLIDVESGRPVVAIGVDPRSMQRAFSPDLAYMAEARPGGVFLRSLREGDSAGELPGSPTRDVTELAFTADANHLWVKAAAGSELWSVQGRQRVWSSRDLRQGTTVRELLADASRALVERDGAVALLDVMTGRELATLWREPTSQRTRVLACNGGDAVVAFREHQATLACAAPTEIDRAEERVVQASGINAVAASAEAAIIATAGADGTVSIQTTDGDALPALPEHDWGKVSAVALSARGDVLAIGSESGQVTIVGLERGASSWGGILGHACPGPARIARLEFGRRRDRLAAWSNKTLSLIEIPSGRLIASMPVDDVPEDLEVTFSEDGARLLAFSKSELRVINAESGESVAAHLSGAAISKAVFSPDGGTIAVGSVDGGLAMYRVADLSEPSRRFDGHTRAIRAIAFSADGTRLATSSDESVRMWATNFDLRRPLLRLRQYRDVRSLQFSRDNSTLIFAFSWGVDALRAADAERVKAGLAADDRQAAIHMRSR